jgi:hypothetical protein
MAIGDRWASVGFLYGQWFISAGAIIEEVAEGYRIVKGVDSAPQGLVLKSWRPTDDLAPGLRNCVRMEKANG